MDNLIERDDQKYVKSNFIISSKYRSTLVENKIMAISLANIDKAIEEDGKIISRIPATTIRTLLGKNKKSGSFYDQLFTIALGLSSRKMAFRDPERNAFCILNIISKAEYADGIFTIKYDNELKDYLIGIKENFTTLSLNEMLSFESVYAFRMYEILKSKAYYPKGTPEEEKNNVYKITFSLAEFKLDLGIVNTELHSVQTVLNAKAHPDFEKAVNASPEKLYSSWRDLKRYVIDTAVKEINEKTVMHIDYDTNKGGKGNKVQEIVFIVTLPQKEVKKKTEKNELSQEDKDIFHDEVMNIIKERISIPDIRSISEAADYDLEKIKVAYQIAEETNNINDLTAFIISAITHKYKPKSNVKKNRTTANTFNNFMQREYDYEELESLLLANN